MFDGIFRRIFAKFDKNGESASYNGSVKQAPSPNFAAGVGRTIDTIVLHNTAGTLAPSLQRLQDPNAQVSAHYAVDRGGEVYQLVDEKNVAWHAGNRDVNARSIGIEIVAYNGALGMTNEQEKAVVALIRGLVKKYKIKRENIVPHRKVRATACPSLIWKTDADLEAWKAAKEF